MHKFRFYAVPLFLAWGFLQGCNPSHPVITDEAAYTESMAQWHQARLERLKGPDGWLNLAGLLWLEEGENSFGSDTANDIVFPAKAAPFCGTLWLEGGTVTLKVRDGISITHDGKPVTEMELKDDQQEGTTKLKQGDLAWYIIRRISRAGRTISLQEDPSLRLLSAIMMWRLRFRPIMWWERQVCW